MRHKYYWNKAPTRAQALTLVLAATLLMMVIRKDVRWEGGGKKEQQSSHPLSQKMQVKRDSQAMICQVGAIIRDNKSWCYAGNHVKNIRNMASSSPSKSQGLARSCLDKPSSHKLESRGSSTTSLHHDLCTPNVRTCAISDSPLPIITRKHTTFMVGAQQHRRKS